MYTESNVKLSCNALWQKCVLATLYRAAATHPEIKLLQFKLIPGQGINKAIPSLMADFTGELHRLISEYLQCKWICPYISRHLLSLNPLLACCRRYSRGER
ncbi:hypothetical protein BvCmsKSNP012_04618 [Escherichia coli]|nr:hypothetical protein BvCmsKSNP012_04618 [Escherichia coli]